MGSASVSRGGRSRSGGGAALSCWGAIVAYRRAGAAPVLVGGLGGEAQGAAPSSHVVHVIIGLIHEAGGEAGVNTMMGPYRPGHHAGSICPLTERHHLGWDSIKVLPQHPPHVFACV